MADKTPTTNNSRKVDKGVKLPIEAGFSRPLELWNMTGQPIHLLDIYGNYFEIPDQSVEGGHAALFFRQGRANVVKSYRRSQLYGNSETYYTELSELVNEGGALFIPTLNMVACLPTTIGKVRHPLSHYTKSDFQDMLMDQLSISCTLVDNEGRLPEIWFTCLGLTRLIKSKAIPVKPSGIYITANNNVVDGQARPKEDVKFIPIADLIANFENRGKDYFLNSFHRTKADAESFGDVSTAIEREHQSELAAYKRERDIATKEFEESKRAHDVTLLTLEKQQKEMEHVAKLEALTTKDHYEKRSYSRKDSSEVWKYLPVAVSTLGLLVSLLKA